MSEEREDTVTDVLTKESLIEGLRSVGVSSDMIIEVHARMSSFNYVVGGAGTIVDALMELCGKGGTIIMPLQISDNTEPSDWEDPPVAPAKIPEIRQAIPAYDPLNGNIHYMGAVAENFRHREGVMISSHPSCGYGAWGRYAKLLCNRQSLHFPLAEESFTARLYELKGKVLLLGADFASVTSMHLAEYRNDCRPIGIAGAAVDYGKGKIWQKYLDLNLDSSVFARVRPIMAKKNMIRETMLAGSHIQFFSAVDAVDEASKYLEKTVIYDLYR